MARPPVHIDNPATSRIEEAFWQLLEETNNYSALTIASLTRRAQVNHNTFYYHYRNIHELGEILIDQLTDMIPTEEIFLLATHGKLDLSSYFDAHPHFETLLTHASLIARAGSSELREHMSEAVKIRWFTALGIDNNDDVPTEANLLITFLIGGFMSVLARSTHQHNILTELPHVMSHGLAQAALDTLNKFLIASDQDTPPEQHVTQ